MDQLHSLLKRQIKKHLSLESIPDEMDDFINAVNDAFNQSDTDRVMLEHSLELSSKELLLANAEQQAILQAFPDLFLKIDDTGKILDSRGGYGDDFYIPPEKLIGRNIEETHMKIISENFIEAVKSIRNSGFMSNQEYCLTKENKKLFYEARLLPLSESQIILIVRNITERKLADEKQLESDRKHRAFLDNINVGVVAHAPDTTVLYCNQKAHQLLGLTMEQMIGKTAIDPQWKFLNEDGTDMLLENYPINHALKDNEEFKDYVVGIVYPDKKNVTWVSCNSLSVMSEGKLEHVLISFFDITKRKSAEAEKGRLESRLQQAQKMEAIGTLAGGIAHDFNNILAAILGYTEMARDDCPSGSSVVKDLNQVLEAGNRAKGLVKQILAFSRQGDAERFPIQPTIIIKEAIKMLRPSLPTTIEIIQNIASKTGLILADPTHMNQILLNLGTNAFHAMEETGGRLEISLKETTLSSEDLVHEPETKPGTFIQLSISDSGSGMNIDTKEKIFDPYFTTKGVGKGTGMGLSITHGIVKSYGGFISLYSEIGKGTVFHIFIPVIEEVKIPKVETVDELEGGKERVLFIDDEEILAKMGRDMLERLGYHVTVKKSSLEALETFQSQPDQFDIVITDQTMPGMTGSDLARRMMQIRSDIPIILCTGYSTIISSEKAKEIGIKEFALKPLAKRDLSKLIRKVLDTA